MPLEYRASTWSWASIDAEISYSLDRQSYAADSKSKSKEVLHPQVLEVNTTPLTADYFGIITDGYLRIRGPLRQATRTRPSYAICWIIDNKTIELKVMSDIEPKNMDGFIMYANKRIEGFYTDCQTEPLLRRLISVEELGKFTYFQSCQTQTSIGMHSRCTDLCSAPLGEERESSNASACLVLKVKSTRWSSKSPKFRSTSNTTKAAMRLDNV